MTAHLCCSIEYFGQPEVALCQLRLQIINFPLRFLQFYGKIFQSFIHWLFPSVNRAIVGLSGLNKTLLLHISYECGELLYMFLFLKKVFLDIAVVL